MLVALMLAAMPAKTAPQIVSQLPPSAAISTVSGGCSYDPIISANGRYVLFASTSANLISGLAGQPMPQDFPARMNVFLRDRQTGVTTLASVNSTGTAGGNGDSFPSAISSDGQFVVFESTASDLIAGDTNAVSDVFVRDTVNNTTTLVSVSTNGSVGNGFSRDATITPDGRYVAFVSAANNLVAGDTNGIPDVFVRDLQLGVTTLASPGATAFTGASGTPLTPGSSSEGPVLSVDGRYVAFYSTAVGLVSNATSAGELYVRDLVQGSTIWVSTNAHSIDASAVSANYAMSTNGQLIAYQTTGGTPSGLVFRYNVATGACDHIATNGAMITSLDGEARAIDISADGRFVAFTLADTSSGDSIQLWDASSNSTTLISGGTLGALCEFPRVDQTGRYVAFASDEVSLTTNSDGSWHVYLRDTTTDTIQLADVSTNGITPISFVTLPFHLRADGSAISFGCMDGALSINPYKSDAFLRDFTSNTTEIISAAAPTLPSVTPLYPSGLTASSVSSNGQYVAFVTSADGLVSTDTNGCEDVFVHDLVSGSNTLVSVSASGPYSGHGNSSEPAISSDGRYVAFSSSATDLIASDTNNSSDVFLRDLQTGSTVLVSVDVTGLGEGNGNSLTPQISADGQHVLFFSLAKNLTTNTSVTGENIYWRDVQAGVTYALSTGGGALVAAMTPDGSNVVFGSGFNAFFWNPQSNSTALVEAIPSTRAVVDVAISADAHRAAFETANETYAADLVAHTNWLLAGSTVTSLMHCQFSGDGDFLAYMAKDNLATNQVYLYDFANATNTLVSQSYDSTSGGNSASDSPAIDPTGRFVAYRSAATNLVPGDANGWPDIFLYDRLTGGTTLISVSAAGARSASGPSLRPVFSGDGQTLFFESWASDVAPGDFNDASDVFALALPISGSENPTNTPPLAFTGIAWETPNGQYSADQPLILTWASAAGGSYQVQFKNNLTDPAWQPLQGPATVVGNQGQIIDFTPGATQRFYRVVSY